MLHDMDLGAGEGMVGYHIFRTRDRGRGYGTSALNALCSYALELGLQRLVVITSVDNAASRRIAEKCGFRFIGPAREGPHLVVFERASRRAHARSPLSTPRQRGGGEITKRSSPRGFLLR